MNLSKLKGLKNKKDGFTLIELLVVIIIIGILFVVLIPRLNFATDAAKLTGVKTDFHSMKLTMEQIVRTESQLPGTDLTTAVSKFNTYSDIKFTVNDNGTAADPSDDFATSDVLTPFGGNYRMTASSFENIVGGQPVSSTINLGTSDTLVITPSGGAAITYTATAGTNAIGTVTTAIAALTGVDSATIVDGHLVIELTTPVAYGTGVTITGSPNALAQLGLKAGVYTGSLVVGAPNAPEVGTAINFGAAGGNLSVSSAGLGNNLYQ